MRVPDTVHTLERDLRAVFGSRLQSLVAYCPLADNDRSPTPTLALVDGLTAEDLRSCSLRVASWRDAGLRTPLLLAAHEFERSLDAFPFEFGAILNDYEVISGPDPFEGLRVEPMHLRRACERQARSHLLHLREGYLETEGRGDAIADLIVDSARPLAAIIESVARLRGVETGGAEAEARGIEALLGVNAGAIGEIVTLVGGRSLSPDHARYLFPRYLNAFERLTRFIDQWVP